MSFNLRYQLNKPMTQRRLVFGLTFFSYALIHSVRTSWAYVKPYLQAPPISFDKRFLGILDMVCLLSLAVSLKLFGWIGDWIGYKLFLLVGMCCLTLAYLCTSLLLLADVNSWIVYVVMLSLVGLFSCPGWPSCLSIMSVYYPAKENGFLLSLWNGCSQFGDLVALFAGYLIIYKAKYPPQGIMLIISLLLILVISTNWLLLNSKSIRRQQQRNLGYRKSLSLDSKKDGFSQFDIIENVETNIHFFHAASIRQMEELQQKRQKKEINFVNVWLLPSVASYVLCFGCLKAVNSVLLNWLVAYLYQLGLKSYLSSLTIAWSISSFIGSLMMGYFNSTVNRLGLIIPLLVSSLIFVMLAEGARHISVNTYFVMITLSGVCFGGPYGLVGSKVALSLANDPQIKSIKGAMGVIISLMEGFGQLSAALSVVAVPLIGLKNFFFLPFVLCSLSAVILVYEHVKQENKAEQVEAERREQELNQEQIPPWIPPTQIPLNVLPSPKTPSDQISPVHSPPPGHSPK